MQAATQPDHSRPQAEPLGDDVELTESLEVTEAGSPPANRTLSPPRPTSPALSAPVIRGLLIGAAMGLVIVTGFGFG